MLSGQGRGLLIVLCGWTLYHTCVTHLTSFFSRNKDKDGMKGVATGENMAYSSHPNQLIPPDNNSSILIKENLPYTSHSGRQSDCEGPAPNREYEAVDAALYMQ